MSGCMVSTIRVLLFEASVRFRALSSSPSIDSFDCKRKTNRPYFASQSLADRIKWVLCGGLRDDQADSARKCAIFHQFRQVQEQQRTALRPAVQLFPLLGQLHKRIADADVRLRAVGLLVLPALRPVPSERPARRPIAGVQLRDLLSASAEAVRGQHLQRCLLGVRSAAPVLAEQLPTVSEPGETVRAVQQGAERGNHR